MTEQAADKPQTHRCSHKEEEEGNLNNLTQKTPRKNNAQNSLINFV
jgi:hypothetical protein